MRRAWFKDQASGGAVASRTARIWFKARMFLYRLYHEVNMMRFEIYAYTEARTGNSNGH
jgi:hypothetical protein